MKVIWKYPLIVSRNQTIRMPEGAQVLCVQMQDDEPHLWAMVDTQAPRTDRTFYTMGTGRELPEGSLSWHFGHYIGTYQTPPYTFHVFEGE